MRLAQFIRSNTAPIADEWLQFARTCTPAADAMNLLALRDDIEGILGAIAADLDAPQTESERNAKSKGIVPRTSTVLSSAEIHGHQRVHRGFTLEQLISEYRALRASVLHLWARAHPEGTHTDLVDVTRFNEAIDQAVAESAASFAKVLGQSRDFFLAVLGHDLRNPLNAIVQSAELLSRPTVASGEAARVAARINISAQRMSALINGLLELTRTRLGTSIPITRAPVNLHDVVEDVLNEFGAAHPSNRLKLTSEGDLNGEWDGARLAQVVSNLVANAVEHGTKQATIAVSLQGSVDEIFLSVHNDGAPMTTHSLENMYSPLMPQSASNQGRGSRVRLGLFIAREIIASHGGTLHIASSDAGTTVTARWPRHIGRVDTQEGFPADPGSNLMQGK